MKIRSRRLIYGTIPKSSWSHSGETRNPQREKSVFQQTFKDENSTIPKQKHQRSSQYVLETPCTFAYKSFGTIHDYNTFRAVVH